jgi:hypothetical protein
LLGHHNVRWARRLISGAQGFVLGWEPFRNVDPGQSFPPTHHLALGWESFRNVDPGDD